MKTHRTIRRHSESSSNESANDDGDETKVDNVLEEEDIDMGLEAESLSGSVDDAIRHNYRGSVRDATGGRGTTGVNRLKQQGSR